MSTADTDRDTLFLVLALRAGLIDQAAFVESCADPERGRGASAGDRLVGRGLLGPRERELVEELLQRNIGRHSGDVRASLSALDSDRFHRALAALDAPGTEQAEGAAAPGACDLMLLTAGGREERYRTRRLHAAGGIGRVWLARDEELGREVALKELRPERAGDPAALRRFLAEAKITGQLEHPSIVPVYDLVLPGDGRPPFYTMRFLRGRTLAEAAAAYHSLRGAGAAGTLALRELLNAFVAVCNAVAYAHARGVIHRDLKGQNVFLGDYGEVVLLDWGLAKVLAEEEPEAPREAPPPPEVSRMATVQGQLLGTPAYMAPEQAMGGLGRPDQRTDVYGLGALLYEVLTGQPPFTGADSAEVMRQVVQDDPVPPGRRVAGTPAALEAVCLKALAKKPADRYPSARDVARDVRNWLANEPVSAYAEPWEGRVRRWLGRHRPVAAASAAAVVVTAAALGAATLLLDAANRREREARRGETDARLRAEDNYRLAREAVDRYLTRVGGDARLKGHGLEPLRKELLEQAGDFYERLARAGGPGGGPAVEAERGHASLRLAEITAETGDRPRALRLAREGRDVFERLAREHPGDGDYRDALAACLDRLGAYCRESGDMGPAKEALDRSVALREEQARDRPDAPEQRYRLAVTLAGLGWWYTDNGRRDEAAATLERALALCESLTRDRPDSVEYRGQFAATLQHLGRLRAGAGQTDRAAAAWEKALPLYEALARERPGEPEYQSQLALTLYNLAALYSNTRRPDRVKAVCERALPVCDRLVAEHPDVPAYRDRRASVRSLLAVALALLGEYRQAAAEAEALASGPVTDGLVWYNAACAYALCSAAAGRDTAGSAADREALTRRYRGRAVEMLRKAKGAGFFRAVRHVRTAQTDADLDPLRQDDDFRKLLRELDAGARDQK